MALSVVSQGSCSTSPLPGLGVLPIPEPRPLRVLLINPPRFNELIGKNPAIVEKHRGYNPPLGILMLASYLQERSVHSVEVIDAQPYEYTYEQLRGVLAEKSFDVAALTAMTFTLIDVFQTCRLIRQTHPHAKIVLGGPHVHLFPDETIRRPEVDFLIQGEGEIVFKDFLDRIDHPEHWREMRGLVYLDEADKVVNNGIAASTEDLDGLGFPARHLIDTTKYTSLLGRSDIITTMFTSRGCPYRCTFCDRPYSPVLSGFRWRTAKHVADEMEMCAEMGIREAFIYDDTFTVRKDRVMELCEEIRQRKLDFKWDVRAHVNTITPDLLKAMASAGCDRVHYGVESGNDRMLKVIKKNSTVDRIKSAFKWTREAGMETLAYFIVGQQTETLADIQDSITLAKELDPNYVHFTIFCPYPGTEIYFHGLETGIIKEDIWRNFAANPQPGYILPVWEENFTRRELQEILVKCYKSFYLRPSYVARGLSRVRSLGELRRKVRAGVSVFRMRPNDQVYSDRLRSQVRDVVPGSPIEVHY
jgi:anaerobic magnesium-protoporphyrin IX monomethyl ester cyclase